MTEDSEYETINEKNRFVDLVLGGPDMSGTSSQIEEIIDLCKNEGLVVRDLRGGEMAALFHTRGFEEFNAHYTSLENFMYDPEISQELKDRFVLDASKILTSNYTCRKVPVAAFTEVDNEQFIPIDPDSADVWIMEEPTRRGAGQVSRTIEQNRSMFGEKLNPKSATYAHQAYRTDEFLRFRNPLREAGKIIVRSRSEESACYQIEDPELLPDGISRKIYIEAPGHKYAFGKAPTDIWIAHAPETWTREEYIQLKGERSNGRTLDDHEMKPEYQLLVNFRYATQWLEELYKEACSFYHGKIPRIHRFSLYMSPEERKEHLKEKLKELKVLSS